MEPRDPGRPTPLDGLGPGTCFVMPTRDGPVLALAVSREGRREVLLLNRRVAAGEDLPLICGLAAAEATLLVGAVLAPSGAVAAVASGPRARAPAALHLDGARRYLCGIDEFGRLATFEVESGLASGRDVAELPRATRWRVLVPQGYGLVTVYESGPA